MKGTEEYIRNDERQKIISFIGQLKIDDVFHHFWKNEVQSNSEDILNNTLDMVITELSLLKKEYFSGGEVPKSFRFSVKKDWTVEQLKKNPKPEEAKYRRISSHYKNGKRIRGYIARVKPKSDRKILRGEQNGCRK
jgi:hypothetical protein